MLNKSKKQLLERRGRVWRPYPRGAARGWRCWRPLAEAGPSAFLLNCFLLAPGPSGRLTIHRSRPAFHLPGPQETPQETPPWAELQETKGGTYVVRLGDPSELCPPPAPSSLPCVPHTRSPTAGPPPPSEHTADNQSHHQMASATSTLITSTPGRRAIAPCR